MSGATGRHQFCFKGPPEALDVSRYRRASQGLYICGGDGGPAVVVLFHLDGENCA